MLSPSDHAAAHRRRVIIGAAKLLLAIGILAFLFYRLRGEQVFQQLVSQPKHWPSLALAQLLLLTALFINYVRWYVLGRALELDFTLPDAVRLGSLGLMLSQVAPGSVGGDLFKAVFIAREQPGKRTEAVASVLIDRVVGLFAMLVVATVGYLIGMRTVEFSDALHALAKMVVAFAAVGALGIALLMTPAFTGPRVIELAGRVPAIGGTLVRLIKAAAAYRHHRRCLFAGILLACFTHTLFVIATWSIGRGLPVTAPSLLATFVIGPLSLATGAIPLTPSGLGTFEAAMDALCRAAGSRPGEGLLIAITYRVMTYVMVAVGAAYYLKARRTVAQVLHEAEEIADDEALGQA
jgi:uncharacterized membrane protein YbhN (UPF0104 family)